MGFDEPKGRLRQPVARSSHQRPSMGTGFCFIKPKVVRSVRTGPDLRSVHRQSNHGQRVAPPFHRGAGCSHQRSPMGMGLRFIKPNVVQTVRTARQVCSDEPKGRLRQRVACCWCGFHQRPSMRPRLRFIKPNVVRNVRTALRLRSHEPNGRLRQRLARCSHRLRQRLARCSHRRGRTGPDLRSVHRQSGRRQRVAPPFQSSPRQRVAPALPIGSRLRLIEPNVVQTVRTAGRMCFDEPKGRLRHRAARCSPAFHQQLSIGSRLRSIKPKVVQTARTAGRMRFDEPKGRLRQPVARSSHQRPSMGTGLRFIKPKVIRSVRTGPALRSVHRQSSPRQRVAPALPALRQLPSTTVDGKQAPLYKTKRRAASSDAARSGICRPGLAVFVARWLLLRSLLRPIGSATADGTRGAHEKTKRTAAGCRGGRRGFARPAERCSTPGAHGFCSRPRFCSPPSCNGWRSFSLVSNSFPDRFPGGPRCPPGSSTDRIDRHQWEKVRARLNQMSVGGWPVEAGALCGSGGPGGGRHWPGTRCPIPGGIDGC
jgi:hypothetical protein